MLFLGGCLSTPSPQAPTPAPSPPIPVVTTITPGSWTFSLAPGTATYRVSRTAAIENTSDSGRREISTNSTSESLSLLPGTDSTGFTAVVDTFATTTQGAIGPGQTVQLPLQIAGSLIGDSVAIVTDSISEKCSPVTTALITDVRNLLPRLPTLLSPALSWRDSTNLLGCQGSVPTRSRISRTFQVIGETAFEATPVLVVQRTDSIQAEGEGAQQQHQLQLTASGAGSATYYLQISSGRILHLTVTQDLTLTITASGKTSNFRQNAKEEFALAR